MNIGIIGLGLMGGSFGRTIVKQGIHTVYGLDIDDKVMLKAEMLKAYNYMLDKDNCNKLDLLVVATVPSKFENVITPFLPLLKDGCIVSDFCGTKKNVIRSMNKLKDIYPNLSFVGGHPMAGREVSGISKSLTTLFDRASMILVPVNIDIFKLDILKKFYLSLGFSEVVFTTAENHDKMISFTSQLCHIVSNAYIKNKVAEEHFGYSAGSYKDLTRVAKLDPKMWSELMMENRDNLIPQLSELIDNLKKYEQALKKQDSEQLFNLLSEGNERKIKIDSK